jgi:soluble lytic murein transglycosylase-like protein
MRNLGLAAALLLAAAPAWAEIALLRSGTTLKVSAWRAEDALVFLAFRGGGEIGLPASELLGLVPDEVLEEVEAARDPQELGVLVAETARRHDIDPDLVLAVVTVESAFRPDAVSRKGAQGLMQLMPGTAASLGVRDPLDPRENLEGGVRHLGALLTQYGGDLRKALAAYNAGAGAVERYRGLPPYRETRDYVRRVLERYERRR